jgi:hypothetical protein
VQGNSAVNFDTLQLTATQLAHLLFPELTAVEISEVVAELTAEHTVTLTPSATIVDETFESWIAERREVIETPRWNAYQELLVQRDWDEPVIRDLANQTDEIVELLGDPTKPGPWSRKGLLMGEVQSGKTATYLGVLNKALDYGYRLVIVIGGHTNELRRQTQLRFDSDLFGIDSEYLDDAIGNIQLPVSGIGKIDATLKTNVMTTVRQDFNANQKGAGISWVNSQIPTVFVIKKNARLIKNVTRYIKQQSPTGQLDIPLILIDDEADWGTPNVREETDPAAVNRAIRELLNSSDKSSYLGITATPFANIFIDHSASHEELEDDVFPKSFIRVMSTNSKYTGINQYFQPRHSSIRVDVDDCLEILPIKHRRNLQVAALPASLKEAIMAFFLGTATRRLRDGGRRAASMMVNVSRFNDVQDQITTMVERFAQELVNVALTEFGLGKNAHHSDLYSKIESVWRTEFKDVKDVSFSEVKQVLSSISDEFKVELVNSRTASARRRDRRLLSAEQRHEEDLRPHIYVGGDVLSRGLTLEGLQVSYFVREPRTMDALMQMGRWFGYRPGYGDLVRIWIPEETAADFAWSAETTEELRQMLLEMKARNLTPKQFGLRMRTHPEGFLIVAANRSRAAKTIHTGSVLWENKFEQAWALPRDTQTQLSNFDALKSFIDKLNDSSFGSASDADKPGSAFKAWRDVPLESVQAFVREFKGATSSVWWGPTANNGPSQITATLEDAKGSATWDVVLVGGSGPDISLAEGTKIKASLRNKMELVDSATIKLKSRRLAAEFNLLNSLSDSDREAFERHWALKEDKRTTDPSEKDILSFIQKPLLLIYALVTDSPDASISITQSLPLISMAIAFPKLDPEEAIIRAENAKTFLVNTVYFSNLMGYQEDGDDTFDDEEM